MGASHCRRALHSSRYSASSDDVKNSSGRPVEPIRRNQCSGTRRGTHTFKTHKHSGHSNRCLARRSGFTCIYALPTILLTCAKRREFSGMIHRLTINNNPSNPQQPIHSLRLETTCSSPWRMVGNLHVSFYESFAEAKHDDHGKVTVKKNMINIDKPCKKLRYPILSQTRCFQNMTSGFWFHVPCQITHHSEIHWNGHIPMFDVPIIVACPVMLLSGVKSQNSTVMSSAIF